MLSDHEAAALRQALKDYCTGSADFSPSLAPELIDAIACAAHSARRRGAWAEQFVIELKSAWEALADERAKHHHNDAAGVRDAIVSAAIEAYYMQ